MNQMKVELEEKICESVPLKIRESIILDVSYNKEDKTIKVTWGDGHRSSYHLIWLRDEDRSVLGFDMSTNQRLVSSGLLPLDIGLQKIRLLEGGKKLEIEWDLVFEGIESSVYDGTFLRQHCSTLVDRSHSQTGSLPAYAKVWGKEMKSILPTLSVPFEEIMRSDDAGEKAVLRLLAMVRVYGVGIISGTPRCKETSQKAVERFSPVRHTLYGGFWETKVLPKDDIDNIDSAYSTVPLPAHTDGNYFEDPPGLQIFHCLQADPTGGDTLLVDGFRASESLRRADPAAFALLTAQPVAFRHDDPRHRLEARHRVIGLDEAGRIARFHYNNLDRAPLRGVAPQAVPAFYRAWRALTAAVEDPEGEVWVKLEPGSLIVINNRRVMHGRSGVSGHSGRVLVGAYVTYEDYMSRLSVLHARFGGAGALGPSLSCLGRLPCSDDFAS